MNKTGYIHSSSRSDAVYPYFLFPAKDVPVYPFRRSGRRKKTAPCHIAQNIAMKLCGFADIYLLTLEL